MSNDDDRRVGLVPSEPVALSRASALSLVHRAVEDLLAKAEADECCRQGLHLWAIESYNADIAAESKRRREATECFHRGLQLDPHHAGLQFCIGCAHFVDAEPENYIEAVTWWHKAAEQGDSSAQSHLEAIEGDAQAQFNVGATWGQRSTFGVVSFAQAAVWYRMAAERGHAGAQNNLARFYETGHAVGRDYQQAEYWYRMAAEQGDSKAQCNLGDLYARGQGAPQDHNQATHWYRKAADQGDENAQRALEDMERAKRYPASLGK